MRTSAIFSFASLLVSSALAQSSVPAALSSGFTDDNGLQVSFQGDRANGFRDGATLALADVQRQPEFALGDSSAIQPRFRFVIMMVDSTDANNLVLHYLQSNFRPDGDRTGLSAQGAASVPYQPPSASASPRQYSFLLFRTNADVQLTGFPQAGQRIDMVAFMGQNNLRPAQAGVAMMVDQNAAPGAGGNPAAMPGNRTSATPVGIGNIPPRPTPPSPANPANPANPAGSPALGTVSVISGGRAGGNAAASPTTAAGNGAAAGNPNTNAFATPNPNAPAAPVAPQGKAASIPIIPGTSLTLLAVVIVMAMA